MSKDPNAATTGAEDEDVVVETTAVEIDESPADQTVVAVEGSEVLEADGTEAEAPSPQTLAAEAAIRRRWTRIGAVTLAVLLVLGAAATAWLYFASYRPDQLTDAAAQATVQEAAKSGAVAILSYSPETLDADLSEAKSRLTGEFLDYYSDFTDEVVRPAVRTKQVSTTATVVRSAVAEMHPDTAKVLLFINQTTTSDARPAPSVAQSAIMTTLQRVSDKWLISAFDPI